MFILIAISVFIVVALAAFVVFSLMDERSSKARLLRERLSSVDKAPEREPGEELALLRDEVLSKIPAFDNLLRRWPRVAKLQTMLELWIWEMCERLYYRKRRAAPPSTCV